MNVTVAKPRMPSSLVGWLAAALVTAVPIWWLHAIPVLTTASSARHAGHFPIVFVHMIGGTAMLFGGAAALYLGAMRRQLSIHRRIGQAYLLIGGVGAAAGLLLSILNRHHVTGIMIATGTLAATWLAVALLAYRAARLRRFDLHRDMMIRSYVLTWTFVGCRIAGRVPGAEEMGDPGGAAIVWLAWVGPMIVCELFLHARDLRGRADLIRTKTSSRESQIT